MENGQPRICTRCGERNQPHFVFCWKCGTDLSAPPARYFPEKRKKTALVPIVSLAVIMAVGYVTVEHLDGSRLKAALAAKQAPTRNTQVVGAPKPAAERTVVTPAPTVALIPSVWPEDHQRGTVDEWSIFEVDKTACLAKKSFPNDDSLVLGRMKGTGDFILGMSGDLPKTVDRTLTLVFDGTRSRRPYLRGDTKTVVGRYGDDSVLVREISKSGVLQIVGENGRTVALSLVGTRAALTAVNDCLLAMSADDSARNTKQSILPEARLCEDRPSNGQLLTKRGGLKAQGHKITVRNSAQGDAVVKIRNEATGKLAYSFTVHKNKEASIKGVQDGLYRLQFAYGDFLGGNCVDFLNPKASEFDRAVQFRTQVKKTKNAVTTYTQDYTATLYAVTGGNAPTSSIDPARFLED